MSDESLHQRMLASIGEVAMNSGHASMALQQLVETVTGTGLIYFLLRDAPLGSQLKQVRTLVERADTNEWIAHPPVDGQVRDLILEVLAEARFLVELRNRVVHDIWHPAPSDEHPDGIRGFRATRWGKTTVQSSIGTFCRLASAFFLVAVALQAAEGTLLELRDFEAQPWRTRADVLSGAKDKHDELVSRVKAIRAGSLAGWHWEETAAASPKA